MNQNETPVFHTLTVGACGTHGKGVCRHGRPRLQTVVSLGMDATSPYSTPTKEKYTWKHISG
jgi:hypothetical protein